MNNKQKELNTAKDQKRWQASEKYAENKPKLAQTKLQDQEMIEEHNRKEQHWKSEDHNEESVEKRSQI